LNIKLTIALTVITLTSLIAFGFAFVAWGFNRALGRWGQPDGFDRAAMRLSEYRKINPGALERFVFYDHPSGYDRVHMAMLWKAEHQDSEPPER
jgi:hypothetical protein